MSMSREHIHFGPNDDPGAGHCWHRTKSQCVIRGYVSKICCVCGVTKTFPDNCSDPAYGHGPFYPRS